MLPKINLALAFGCADPRIAALGEAQDTTKHDNEVRAPRRQSPFRLWAGATT